MDVISFIFYELLKFFKDSGPSLASWATVAGVIMIFLALITIRSNNSAKRMELISKIYARFLEDELHEFYMKIRNKGSVDWRKNKDDERLLNQSLTLFDEVDYLQIQGLLDKKAWEYVASEIQYFALNESVWDYMIQRIQECKDRGFPEDIMPFTGFPELLGKVPKEFKANPFPVVPDRYKVLISSLPAPRSSSCMCKFMKKLGGGWQRLWIVISVILLVIYILFAYKFQKNLDRTIFYGVVGWLGSIVGLYLAGWAIGRIYAWVSRGFTSV